MKLAPYNPKCEETSRITEVMAGINDPQNAERTLENMKGLKRTDFLIRNYLRYKAKQTGMRKSDELRDYVLIKDAELVIELLDGVLRKLKESKNVSRPIRFLQDHNIIARPTFKALIKCYPYLKDKVSESRFNDDSGYYWVELVSLINTHFLCPLIHINTLYLPPGFQTINNMYNLRLVWAHSVSQT